MRSPDIDSPARLPTLLAAIAVVAFAVMAFAQGAADVGAAESPMLVLAQTAATPTATGTPFSSLRWARNRLALVIQPGASQDVAITFRVSTPVSDPRVSVTARDGTITASPLPPTLEPGQDYTLNFRVSMRPAPAPRTVSGYIAVTIDGRKLGPTLFITAQPGQATTTPTRSPTATVTVLPTFTSTPSASPSPTLTLTPTVTPYARMTWDPDAVNMTIRRGTTLTASVTLTSNRAVDSPTFRIIGQRGAVTLDPTSRPDRLEAGQAYTLRFILRVLTDQTNVSTSTVAVRSGGRSLGQILVVRLRPG
jgi:hypothetical protein